MYLLDSDLFGKADSFDWGKTAPLGTISLAVTKNDLSADKTAALQENILAFANELIDLQNKDGYAVLIKGEYPWGSNGLILNNMILMGIAHDISGDAKYLDAMRLSMDYILGRNPLNKSYVSGYGTYPMQHPHHRFWANDPADGYPSPPPGALSGGPNAEPSDPAALEAGVTNLAPSKRYVDELGSYSTNEVTINWNAPLAWAATFLNEKSNWTQPVTPEPEPTEPMATPQEPEPPFLIWSILIVGCLLLVAVAVWFVRKRA